MVRAALAGAQKGAHRRGQTSVWVDASGFDLLPAVVRTDAPQAQTPVLHVPLSRDHLSVISGITLDDRLLLMVHAQAIRGPEVVRFLKHLLRHLPGQVLVIWDGAPLHHGKAVQAFLADGGAARRQLEILPGYAPHLNPDAGIWNYLKRVELRNLCCATLDHLHHALRLATARLRHKRTVIHGCFLEAGYRL